MLKRFFKWLKYRFSRRWCYDEMEVIGAATSGMCGGRFGGGPETQWLSYDCMDCPYWVNKITNKERKNHEK